MDIQSKGDWLSIAKYSRLCRCADSGPRKLGSSSHNDRVREYLAILSQIPINIDPFSVRYFGKGGGTVEIIRRYCLRRLRHWSRYCFLQVVGNDIRVDSIIQQIARKHRAWRDYCRRNWSKSCRERHWCIFFWDLRGNYRRSKLPVFFWFLLPLLLHPYCSWPMNVWVDCTIYSQMERGITRRDEIRYVRKKEINLSCALRCPWRENRLTQWNLNSSASKIPIKNLSF